MIEFVIPAADAEAVRETLTSQEVEGCAVLYASATRRERDGTVRLLVREVEFPSPSDYAQQGRLEVELSPLAVAGVTKRARRESLSLIFAHSHPGSAPPSFSSVDDEGERHLEAFLSKRHPMPAHGALVVSMGGARARRLGTSEEARIVVVGSDRSVLFDPELLVDDTEPAFDRQVRAFGARGQQTLQLSHARWQRGLRAAERHRNVIRRFGRFPHRNALLGRPSTAEELAFLKEPGSSFA